MGYWIAVQVSTMMRSVLCKSNLRMEENILRRVLIITWLVLLRGKLMSRRSIDLLDSDRGRVDGLGDQL